MNLQGIMQVQRRAENEKHAHDIDLQVVPGQAGGGNLQNNKPIGNGHVAG